MMVKFSSAFKKIAQPHIVCVLTLFVLMLLWLFIYPHGLADNGDFFRIIHNLGLSHFGGTDSDNYFNYFTDKYWLTGYFIDNKVSFLSTQTIVIMISIGINRIFNHSNIYDIRSLAFVYVALYLITKALILLGLSHGYVHCFLFLFLVTLVIFFTLIHFLANRFHSLCCS
jgi:hypothetical protein